MVYPGAHHTRFHHAIGCMHLMQQAVRVLRFKGVKISENEENAVLIAILLHDIGHGPFSHAMEHSIVNGVSHEEISLLFMERLNKDFNGKLSLAIEVFKGDYKREFLHQLISSQMDMDRLDYLKRDSFYTGVAEGNVNSERLITMLNVVDDELVVEEKGIYSVEKFLLSRRLMYWQVYLHKTSLVAENLLIRILQRAKYLVAHGHKLPCGSILKFFLYNPIDALSFNSEVLNSFSKLDDFDVVSAIKEWTNSDDKVLNELSRMIINRDLLKVEMKATAFDEKILEDHEKTVQERFNLSKSEAKYFVFTNSISNQAYNKERQNIKILFKDQKIKDITAASDQYNLEALSKKVTKYFMCYPKP